MKWKPVDIIVLIITLSIVVAVSMVIHEAIFINQKESSQFKQKIIENVGVLLIAIVSMYVFYKIKKNE